MAACDEGMQAQDGNGLRIDGEAIISVSIEKNLIDEMILHNEDGEMSMLCFPTYAEMLFVWSFSCLCCITIVAMDIMRCRCSLYLAQGYC
jgi:hypothetical protein